MIGLQKGRNDQEGLCEPVMAAIWTARSWLVSQTRTAVRYEFSQTGAKAASSQAAFIVSSFRSLGISTPLI
jgi:hypothetical protein